MTKRGLTILVAAFTSLSMASLAQAQATRTWVSGVGDDANPCSRTAPCKTFAGAISKTAASGEINVLDVGGFGAVTITKAITIDGGGSFASILASLTNGIIVNAGAGDVITLRNLSIDGAGNGIDGIRYLAGGIVNVENVVIFRFTQHGINVSKSAGGALNVTNTTITNCGGSQGGIRINTSAAVVAGSIDRTRVHNCGFGVLAESGVRATVRDSDLSSNTTGIQVNTGSEVNVDTSLFAYSSTGLLSNGGLLRLSNNTVINNGTGLATLGGGQIVSFGNNNVTGNISDGVPTQAAVAPR
jgi:hypothetical protein